MAESKWNIYLLCKERYENRSLPKQGCKGEILVESPRM